MSCGEPLGWPGAPGSPLWMMNYLGGSHRQPVVREHGKPPVVEAPALGAIEAGVDLVGLDCPEEITLQEPEAGAAEPALAQLVGHGGSVPHSSSSAEHQRLDELELTMLDTLPAVDLPLVHRFTPGLYIREIFMPAGTLLTSKIHNTEHPYVVTKGSASVYIPGVGVQRIEAPYIGVTKPGTRRVLFIHEDCTWLTFHPLAEGETGIEDLPKIEERIIEKRQLADGREIHQLYREALRAIEEREMPEQLDYGGAP